MVGTAGAIPLFQDNNVIVFILQNLQIQKQANTPHAS